MITALITTTVNVPYVLRLYRAFGPHIPIFVAGDRKTPQQAWDLCKQIPHCYYYPIETQDQLYPELSKLIGYDTIARRNIALLEALKAGAQIIVTVDDDNFPLNDRYFTNFEQVLRQGWEIGGFSGVQVAGGLGWFDVGQLLDPPSPHRGFPLEVPQSYEVTHAVNIKIGVAAGVCIGDPDISAVTRLARAPVVHGGSRLLDAGVVVSPGTWTVFNSQNTAFIRELAPCFLMLPQIGRYDDIFASIVAQKIMRGLGLQVFFGPPFVWQQRNSHNLVRDLKNELWGYENIWHLANRVNKTVLPRTSSLIKQLYDFHLAVDPFMPNGVMPLVEVWLTEMEKIYESGDRISDQGSGGVVETDVATPA